MPQDPGISTRDKLKRLFDLQKQAQEQIPGLREILGREEPRMLGPVAAPAVSTYGEEAAYEPPPTERAGPGKQLVAGIEQGIGPILQLMSTERTPWKRAKEMRERGEAVARPQTPVQALARGGGRLAGEIPAFIPAMGAGGAITKALTGLARPALARLAGTTGAGLALGAIQEPEAPVRGALDTGAIFALLGGAGEGVATGIRGAGRRATMRRGTEQALRGGKEEVIERLASQRGAAPVRAGDQAQLEAIENLIRTTEAAAPPIGAVATEEYLNLSRFSPAARPKIEERVAAAVEQGRLTRRVIPWEEERRAAAELLGLAPEEIAAAEGATTQARQLARASIINQDALRSAELHSRLANEAATLTDVQRELIEREISALDAGIMQLVTDVSTAGSEFGRALNAQKIMANITMDPAAWYVRAQRTLARSGDGLTDEIRSEIMRLINEGNKEELARYVAGLRTATRGEKAATLWKAGLLTSPTTHIANLTGNTTMAMLETVKDPIALIYDRMLGALTGLETKAPTLRSLTTGQLRGAGRGFGEATEIMRGAPIGDMAKRFDYYREIDFENAFLNTYTKTIFRLLSAEDKVFRGAALERSLTERANLMARSEGLRGQALQRRARSLVAQPTDEMALEAIHDAEYAIFMNQGRLGATAQHMKRTLGPATEFVIPFTMTPANIAERIAEYSPFGALWSLKDMTRLFGQVIKGAPDAALQRRVVERAARSTVGAAPIMAGYILAREGRMTGGYPVYDSQQRARWALEGKHENAVQIGDKWYGVERISPVGNLMAFGANVYDVLSAKDKTPSERLALAAMQIPQSVLEQSFLTGLRDAINVVADPERNMKKYTQNFYTSIIPTIVRRIAYGIDPVVRAADTGKGAFAARIPGLSLTQPAQIDVFGKPRKRLPGIVTALFDPFSTRVDVTKYDTLIRELADINAGITKLTKRKGESDREHRLRQQQHGQILRRALEALIETAEYKGIDIIAERVATERGTDPVELANEIRRELVLETVSRTRRTLTSLMGEK